MFAHLNSAAQTLLALYSTLMLFPNSQVDQYTPGSGRCCLKEQVREFAQQTMRPSILFCPPFGQEANYFIKVVKSYTWVAIFICVQEIGVITP